MTSPLVTNWGVWGDLERCPEGTYVQGFQLKTHKVENIKEDNTAANALRFFCGDPFSRNTTFITSLQGDKGEFGGTYSCYPGYVYGLQLRVEADLGEADNTATNNFRIYCDNAPENWNVDGDGLSSGEWSEERRCQVGQVFCGLKTQVESCSDTDDCTALNNILVECCDHMQTNVYKERDIDF